MTNICTSITGKMTFHEFRRNTVPLIAYTIPNRPNNTTLTRSRVVDCRPMFITSTAEPMMPKMKKTPSRNTARREWRYLLPEVIASFHGVLALSGANYKVNSAGS